MKKSNVNYHPVASKINRFHKFKCFKNPHSLTDQRWQQVKWSTMCTPGNDASIMLLSTLALKKQNKTMITCLLPRTIKTRRSSGQKWYKEVLQWFFPLQCILLKWTTIFQVLQDFRDDRIMTSTNYNNSSEFLSALLYGDRKCNTEI